MVHFWQMKFSVLIFCVISFSLFSFVSSEYQKTVWGYGWNINELSYLGFFSYSLQVNQKQSRYVLFRVSILQIYILHYIT